MRDISDAQRADLTTAVEQLAWTAVREMLQLKPEAGPGSDAPDADLRQMWLATLTSLLAIRDSADQLAASAALSAAQYGADYPAIGEAAGMTRQGARRKWPGLAGLSDERQRKLTWWKRRGDQFAQCVRAVLMASEETSEQAPHLAALRNRLDEIEQTSPAQRLDVFDMALVDAHAVAVGAPSPVESTAARANGLLAALTADAYAAMNSHSSLVIREDLACGTDDCASEPIVELWHPDFGHQPVSACREHAIEALGQPDIRIVAACQPDVALSVFAEAYGEG
ncbi:hypothetical protein [Nonomuraea jabiensis]|uniref:Uncharacterized protein n=1 Tax=Nonomuraea jabiensis TaxID=882448 RepID=A0A7W9GK48_9ACTN|nr:hypothetical protein [Nonomuraea jabiensis]MBB5785250.1 hypothetical protein [Nonomuraea jabiensis]